VKDGIFPLLNETFHYSSNENVVTVERMKALDICFILVEKLIIESGIRCVCVGGGGDTTL
jgi:hypothetical protein